MPIAQLRVASNAQGFLDAQALRNLIDRPDRSHTFGGAHPEGVGILRGELLQAVAGLGNGAADGRQDVRWQMGENSESFGFDLVANAKGLAQKDGGVRTFAALGF